MLWNVFALVLFGYFGYVWQCDAGIIYATGL
jgi:hypothetical protein